MGCAKIKEMAESILNRIESVRGRGEEATKQAMVLPMLSALGYDIWNPSEVCPEFEADVAVKKNGQKEKVDYAILLGGEPKIFIEVKDMECPLDGHQGQLKRYFMSTKTVSLGILTNGLEYRFFTDSGELNIQDDEPFHAVKLDSIDQGLDVMARFQKEVYSGQSIREYALELTYTAKIAAFLKNQIDIHNTDPSDEIVRWVLKSPDMYDGPVTSNVMDRFRPITKQALKRVLNQIVRRIVTEIDEGVSRAPDEPPTQQDAENTMDAAMATENTGNAPSTKDISTTDVELECFATIKRLFDNSSFSAKTVYDSQTRQDEPAQIGYKDTTGYFGVFFNKPSWWILRLSVEGRTKWAGFDLEEEKAKELLPTGFETLPSTTHAPFRVRINSAHDLFTLTDVLFAAFEKTIDEHQRSLVN